LPLATRTTAQIIDLRDGVATMAAILPNIRAWRDRSADGMMPPFTFACNVARQDGFAGKSDRSGIPPMPRSDFQFFHRLRVRYSEIDGQAVVFNARYLDYADLGVAEYFRALGIPIVPGPDTPEFHAAHAAVDFKKPIRLDEEIDIGVRTARIGRTSLVLALELHGRDAEDWRATIELVYVHVDLATGRPAPVPAAVVASIEAHAAARPIRI
jgi:acyl-CoA thioester hydrolase